MTKAQEHEGRSKPLEVEAYCVSCFETRVMENPVEDLTSNGKVLFKGICPECGTKMCRLGPLKGLSKTS